MRRILPLGLAAVDAAWLYPWSLLLGEWAAPGRGEALLPWVEVFGALLLARAATRTVRRVAGPWQRLARMGVVALGLLLVGAAIAARFLPTSDPTGPILLGAFGVGLWWRGLAHGRGPVEFETVEDAFRQGAVGLVLFLAVGAVTTPRLGAVEAPTAPSVVAFFAVALASLAVARLALVREQSRARDGRPPAVSRQWVGVMIASVAAVVLVGLALDALLSFDLIAAAARPLLSALAALVFVVVIIIAIPVAFVADLLIGALRGQARPQQPQQAGDLSEALRRIGEGRQPVQISPEAQAIAQWLGVAVVAAVVAFALYRTIAWWREEPEEEEAEEERDSVWSWREAGAALRALWLALLGRFRRPAEPGAPTPFTVAYVEPAPPAVLGIRELYRQLLGRAAALGAPRPPAATPYEQEPRIAERLAPPEDVAALTEAYVRARYGPEAPEANEVEDARERLERLEPIPLPLGEDGRQAR